MLLINAVRNKNWYTIVIVFIILALLLIYYIKMNKIICFSSLCIVIIIIFNVCIRQIYYDTLKDDLSQNVIKVVDKKANEENIRYLVKSKYHKYYIYLEEDFSVGDVFLISGELIVNDTVHNKYSFNYLNYLKNKGIKGTIKVSEIKYVKHTFSIRIVNQLLNNYLNENFDGITRSYLKTLVIGNSEDLELNSFKKLGISHLFVISGLHASIIAAALLLLLKVFKIPNKYHDIVVLCGLGIYLVACGFMISLIRVFLSTLLKIINRKFYFNFVTLDLFSLNILSIIIWNPLITYDYSFILSYLLSGLLTIGSIKLLKVDSGNKIINYLYSSLKTCIFSFLVSLPIVVVLMNEINFLSIIYNLFYIPLVTFIIMPLSFVVFLIPPFSFLYEYIVMFFSKLSNVLATIELFTISVPKLSIVGLLIYYLILFLCFSKIENKSNYKNKFISFGILGLFFMIWFMKPSFNFKNEITFFDLELGEATLISSQYGRCNILIDTGEVDSYHSVVKYLINEGIKKLDYVFITHSDSDHIGELEHLSSKVKIKNLCFNKYDQVDITLRKRIKIQFLKFGDQIKGKDFVIDVLHPKTNMFDKNDNSLVLMLNFRNKKILFLGDIEGSGERELINNNPNLKCDLVKIAHHGSLTSTSDNLLRNITFTEAVIMNGYNNMWGFPNSITIEKLKNKKVKIYLTKELKTFTLKF